MTHKQVQDWLKVADERRADAEAIHKNNPTSIGAVYMAGYVIECLLKARLQQKSIPYPTRGSAGHDLHGLWTQAFRLSDLRDSKGIQTFYIEKWKTDLRYEISSGVSLQFEVQELMEGAKLLAGWIRTQIRRR